MMILIIILILIFLTIQLYYYSLTFNNKRHLTNSYNYAHFSKINLYNYFLDINFLLYTHPIYIELNEGESLYIPSKMWHWIKSEPNSFSINFWFDRDTNKFIEHNLYKIDPIITDKDSAIIYEQFKFLINNEKKIELWNTSTDKSNIINNKTYTNLYDGTFITLDAFYLNNNYLIKEKIKKFIKKPSIINNTCVPNSFIDFNLWMTNGYHDTGLHYDDNDGILHLIKGKKFIYFYPFEDSKYLKPYSLIPNYALTKPIFMNYNEYKIYNELDKGKSSQYLLYKTLEYFSTSINVNKKIQKIYDYIKNKKKLIWGLKKKMIFIGGESIFIIIIFLILHNNVKNMYQLEKIL